MRGGIHDRGVHGRGHLWQGMCMAGGVHGRGCACMVGVGGHGTESCMVGACMTWEVGVQGKRVCVVGSMYGRGYGRGVRGGGRACRRDSHCSGRYVSYWNAFLSLIIFA